MAISKEYRSYWRTVHSVRFIDLSSFFRSKKSGRLTDGMLRSIIIRQLSSVNYHPSNFHTSKLRLPNTISSSSWAVVTQKWEIFSARIHRKKQNLRLLPFDPVPIQSHLYTTNVGNVLMCIGAGETAGLKMP
jgi:hypothetical protein